MLKLRALIASTFVVSALVAGSVAGSTAAEAKPMDKAPTLRDILCC